ncbi:MAG TPA: phosphopantetheine-binding protein [Thermoanaerobaculia bacterium]|jgi:acyl carrier protein
MADMTMDDLGERLTRLLRKQLTFLAPGQELAPEASLRELGLNSMNAINLLLEIEEEFGVVVPDELLVADTFQNRVTLVGVIASLLSQAETA